MLSDYIYTSFKFLKIVMFLFYIDWSRWGGDDGIGTKIEIFLWAVTQIYKTWFEDWGIRAFFRLNIFYTNIFSLALIIMILI